MFKLSSTYENPLTIDNARIHSIDILRRIVMILMLLDHTRDFFHIYAFDYSPEDLRYTTPIVFYTRWVTHFCAPIFVFLTGVSAYLYQVRYGTTKKELAKYLVIRGLILILLELTIVRFAWRFYIDYSSIGCLILCGIGWSMIALAGLIYLPRKVILGLSLFIIFCHNFLDTISIQNNKVLQLIWAFLHERTYVDVTDTFGVNILYPVLPMIGIIGFGYYIGKWYTREYHKDIRSGYLFYVGLGMISLFVSLRFFQLFTEQYSYLFYLKVEDIELKRQWTVLYKETLTFLLENYGDPSPWQVQENLTYSVMSFFNTTKYPMSLLYILMTLGPAFIVLSYLEGATNKLAKMVEIFGRVPLFYYIIHLFIVHALAILIAVLRNLDKMDEVMKGNWMALSKDYGFSMPIVYLISIGIAFLLYPLCLGFEKIKKKKKYNFLKYL